MADLTSKLLEKTNYPFILIQRLSEPQRCTWLLVHGMAIHSEWPQGSELPSMTIAFSKLCLFVRGNLYYYSFLNCLFKTLL